MLVLDRVSVDVLERERKREIGNESQGIGRQYLRIQIECRKVVR